MSLEDRIAEQGWDIVEFDPPPYGLSATDPGQYQQRLSTIGKRVSEILSLPKTIATFTDSRFGNRSSLHFQALADIEDRFGYEFDKSRILLHFTCNHKKEEYEGLLNSAGELGYQNFVIISGDKLVDENGRNLRGEHRSSSDLLKFFAGLSTANSYSFSFGVGIDFAKPNPETRKLTQKLSSGIVGFALSQSISEHELPDVEAFCREAGALGTPVPPLFYGVLSPYTDPATNLNVVKNTRFKVPKAFANAVAEGRDPPATYLNTIARLKAAGLGNFYHVGGFVAIREYLRHDRAAK